MDPVDVNNSDLLELSSLPVSDELIATIYERILYQGPLESIYDLAELPGMTDEVFQQLKGMVIIMPVEDADTDTRLQDNYRKVEQLSTTEGANEGLVELWLDRLAEPINVNTANYDELVSMQNVSPIDAVAVLKLQDQIEISNQRYLRSAIGLSYYGYRNMRDFVRYTEPEDEGKFHLWYNMTTNSAPPAGGSAEEGGVSLILSNYPNALRHKLVMGYGRHLRLGMAYHRRLAEENLYLNSDGLRIPDGKLALTVKDLSWQRWNLDRLILGDFSATFGQGVTMESTDYFMPRRDGYGWSKRVPGVFSDVSGTRTYGLRGIAVQGGWNEQLRLIGFVSKRERDAVLNPDGDDFTTIINMDSRQEYGWTGATLQPLMNSVTELTYGGNLQYTLFPGTALGFTSYESLYDKELRPDPATAMVSAGDAFRYLTSNGNTADTELAAMHASSATSPLWDEARANRRVQGLEFNTVYRNLAIQGEWAVLDADSRIEKIANDPQALVLNAYLQFDNLNVLVLYRDYDLGFDNPYQRSFANYQRYKGSIMEDLFYLQDPIYGNVYSNAAQPQAEQGWYVSSRYQIHRSLVANLNFDTWTRVADGAHYYRTVARLDYRPAFNYRFRIRQKWQQRDEFNLLSPAPYDSRETRVEVLFRLSAYDDLKLIYANSFTRFSQRRRLTLDLPSGGNEASMVGNAGAPSEALGFTATHNFNPGFKVMGSVLMYRGFFWNFEDTDFLIFDSAVPSLHYWVTVYSRIGDNMAFRLKYTYDGGSTISNYAFAPSGESDRTRLLWETIESKEVSNHIRLQVDYAF